MTGPERDVYTGNSGAWQQSLRGASRSVGSMTTWPASDISFTFFPLGGHLCYATVILILLITFINISISGRRGRAPGADPGLSGHSLHRSLSRGDWDQVNNSRGGQYKHRSSEYFPRPLFGIKTVSGYEFLT